MSSMLKELGIDRLSLGQRLDLMHEIWQSISAEGTQSHLMHEIWEGISAEGTQKPLSETRKAELKRRVAEDTAFPEDVVPWEQIKAEAERRRLS